MGKYSIKDLERLTGIKAHTIRMWEKRYNIITPERSDTNIRTYQDSDLKRLLNIAILNNNGYKISHIACFCSDTIRLKVLEVCQSGCSHQAEIDRLVVCTVDLDEDKFEKILSNNILRIGFERTFQNVVHPFLLKVGVLWQTGSINMAQKRFIINLVRHKIIAAIDGLIIEPNEDSKTFTMFLPQGETFELLMLFYYYLVKKHGHRVIYLGQSVPVDEVVASVKIKAPDYIVAGFSCFGCGPCDQTVAKLGEYFPNQKVFVTIPTLIDRELELAENVNGLKSSSEFLAILPQL